MDSLFVAKKLESFLKTFELREVGCFSGSKQKTVDHVIVCLTDDKKQAKNILQNVLEFSKNELNLVACEIDGQQKADWIIVDFGNIFIHIFQEDTYKKYIENNKIVL